MAIDPLRAKEIFLAAVELPPEERSAFLDRECGADAELRARVMELLAGNQDSTAITAPTEKAGPESTRASFESAATTAQGSGEADRPPVAAV
ncbi:MAG TPA: hypothetical protein VNC50_12510, partial [Planctomycetia bacterium]|nr:hypothetical protein [Planctomycetia bacterium]